MRNTFIETLRELASEDPRIWLICGDLGFSVLEGFASAFPERYLNAGVAEQNMTGIAAGLASCGSVGNRGRFLLLCRVVCLGLLVVGTENPRVADGPACDPCTIDVGFSQHAHDIVCGEEIAAAEDHAVGVFAFQIGQEAPRALSDIFLLDGPGMDAHRRHVVGPRFLNDLVKPIDGFR